MRKDGKKSIATNFILDDDPMEDHLSPTPTPTFRIMYDKSSRKERYKVYMWTCNILFSIGMRASDLWLVYSSYTNRISTQRSKVEF